MLLKSKTIRKPEAWCCRTTQGLDLYIACNVNMSDYLLQYDTEVLS